MAPTIGSFLSFSCTKPVTWPRGVPFSTTSHYLLHDRRPVLGVHRPARAEVERPRRRSGCSSSMKSCVPPRPMSNAASSEKPRFHGKKRLPMRQRRRNDRVVREAVVVARVVDVAGVVLPVVRRQDSTLDERPHALVGKEGLAAEEEVEVVDPVHAEAVALDARDRLARARSRCPAGRRPCCRASRRRSR